MKPINAYGYPNREVGKKGVPSANDVLANPGRKDWAWGVQFEGLGPDHPHLNQGVSTQPLDDSDLLPGRYGRDGTTYHWRGLPSSQAL